MNKEFGDITPGKPGTIILHDGSYVGRFTINGNLTRPGERRTTPFSWLSTRRSSVSTKAFCSRTSFSPAGERKASKFWRAASGKSLHVRGLMIASMYTMPFTASRWRLAQSKPRADPPIMHHKGDALLDAEQVK